jgi:hypothetical protein
MKKRYVIFDTYCNRYYTNDAENGSWSYSISEAWQYESEAELDTAVEILSQGHPYCNPFKDVVCMEVKIIYVR